MAQVLLIGLGGTGSRIVNNAVRYITVSRHRRNTVKVNLPKRQEESIRQKLFAIQVTENKRRIKLWHRDF